MYKTLKAELDTSKTILVAVSKTKPVEAILELYNLGQRVFGENRVQEIVEKSKTLPEDIEWHFIGTLQRKKVKHVVPIATLIHSVDTMALLKKIDTEAAKIDRDVNVLLQFYIATESTKQGLRLEHFKEEFTEIISKLTHTNICGVMGMASFVEDNAQIRTEFKTLKSIFDELKTSYFHENEDFKIISMGMSGDYQIAIDEGSNMVRIGSLLFGRR